LSLYLKIKKEVEKDSRTRTFVEEKKEIEYDFAIVCNRAKQSLLCFLSNG
jgi:hypothetical protein